MSDVDRSGLALVLERLARPYDPERVDGRAPRAAQPRRPAAGGRGAGHERRGRGPAGGHADDRAVDGHRDHRPCGALHGRAAGPGPVGGDDVRPLGLRRGSGAVRVRHDDQGLRHGREPRAQGRARRHPARRPERRARDGQPRRRRRPSRPPQRPALRPPASSTRPSRRSPWSAPPGRALRRTRAGSRRHTYRPALALLRRAAEPMGADHLRAFADERTTRRSSTCWAPSSSGSRQVTGAPLVLRSDRGAITGGPVTFHHPDRAADDALLPATRITVGGLLVTARRPR